jgi:hypothetical protein
VRSTTVKTSTAGDSAATEIYQERGYPQFDCVGSYVWIWERLIRTEDRTEVVTRQVRHDGTPR